MVSFIRLVAVPTILVCGLQSGPAAQSNAKTQSRPEAQAVLDKARETYRRLPDYHFDRLLLLQESSGDGKVAKIAELTLTLATQNAKPVTGDTPWPPINLDRFRLRTKTRQSELVQVCDGRTCWSYNSRTNEYMKGNTFRDVSTSVGGSMVMGFHLFTFSILGEGTIQEARAVRDEEVEVGKERRKCDVIEGQIPPAALPRPGDSQKPPSLASLGMFWLASMLTMQGLTEEGPATRYSAWADESATGLGPPTRVTLWIDQTTHVIVRSEMAAQLYKRGPSTGQAGEKVPVTLTDRFTTAVVGVPPEDLFRFTPPDGAKEVPNAASRRDKKH